MLLVAEAADFDEAAVIRVAAADLAAAAAVVAAEERRVVEAAAVAAEAAAAAVAEVLVAEWVARGRTGRRYPFRRKSVQRKRQEGGVSDSLNKCSSREARACCVTDDKFVDVRVDRCELRCRPIFRTKASHILQSNGAGFCVDRVECSLVSHVEHG